MRAESDGWLCVVEDLQRRIAAEFGVSEQVGLDATRLAESLLPGDNEVVEISHYRKYNRCIYGTLCVGDSPNPPLIDLNASHGCGVTMLHNLIHNDQPCVLLVGSYT
jgi:hypothetical protein